MEATQTTLDFKSKLRMLRKQVLGHFPEIAKELGIDPATVSRVLRGSPDNFGIIEKCIEYRDKLKAEEEQKLKDLADKI